MDNFFFRVRIKMLNVLYILEALRHNNIMAGLLDGRTRKDLYLGEPERIQNNSLIFFFFGYGSKCLTCYISQKRSGIETSCNDFYLGEPERIQNNCLIFFFGYGSKCLACYICYMRSGIVTSFQDFYLGKPERTQNNRLIFFFGYGSKCLTCYISQKRSYKRTSSPGLLPG